MKIKPRKLIHFAAREFDTYWSLMDQDLLLILDELVERSKWHLVISAAPGAIGRSGPGRSFHNYETHNRVKAIDLSPIRFDANRNKTCIYPTVSELQSLIELAKSLGIGGVGVYPDWNPHPGLHLDLGPVRTWSALKVNGEQTYFKIEEGLKAWARKWG